MTSRIPPKDHYSFCGFPLRPGIVEDWSERLVLRDERDGSYLYRERTEHLVAVPHNPKEATS